MHRLTKIGSVLVLAAMMAPLVAGSRTQPAKADPATQAFTTILAGGSYGDGLPALGASFAQPRGVLATSDGLYVSDFLHHQIRLVHPDGTMERIAGTSEGYGGDGGPAVNSQLNRPMGLALDGYHGLLVADGGNSVIRRVDLDSGIITTVAGNGDRGYAGDGGPATRASLAFPTDVAVGPDGSIFIADEENFLVRRVTPDGTIATYAGDGTGNVDNDGLPADRASVHPYSVAVDADGNVFVGDDLGCRIREIAHGSRTISTIAGGNGGCGFGGDGGPATGAKLGLPTDLVLGPGGSMYVVDSSNQRIRRIDPNGTITSVAGNGQQACPTSPGPALQVGLAAPWSLTVDSHGDLLFAVQDCSRVYSLGSDGTVEPFAGNGSGFAGAPGDPAADINFASLDAVAWGPDGRPYFADSRGIWAVASDGTAQLIAGGTPGDKDGPASTAQFKQIRGIAFDDSGALWIADTGAGKVKRLAGGVVTTMAGSGDAPTSTIGTDGSALEVRLDGVTDVAPVANGVYFNEATEVGGRVRLLKDGVVTVIAGDRKDVNTYLQAIGDGGPASKALFRYLRGIAVGPDGSVYVVDSGQNRIRRITPDGTIDTVAGDGGERSRGDGTLATLASFSTPEDVAVDPSGNMFVTDGKNEYTYQESLSEVRQVSPSGMVSRLAGTGASVESRDGPSLASGLLSPQAVAIGPKGLLVADRTTVRLVTPGPNGWPSPARQVVCDPFFPDPEGDASSYEGDLTVLPSPNEPWLDLVNGDVRTDAQTLSVTFQVQDLNEVAEAPPAGPLGTAWAWVYRFTVSGKTSEYRYVAAMSPFTQATAAAGPGVQFEYGSSEFGRGDQGYGLTRQGAATGAFDLNKERVTVTVPLSAVGLEPGTRVVFHEETTGQLLDLGTTFRNFEEADTTFTPGFLQGSTRSYQIGRRCPEDY
ncbi:MAG: hypothetical protein ABR600_07275 [Actinomycetota bacterium]